MCAVVLKDIRIFWRDTAQWGQSLILFGILGIYILNLRFSQNNSPRCFQEAGLVAIIFQARQFHELLRALNLATLTTRFVYPQFSLEGKRLWIGLTWIKPRGRHEVHAITVISLLFPFRSFGFRQHAAFADSPKMFFCGGISVMALALNGLAMGMGVMYPDLKEDNPSKIVSGFGGTFCLVSFVHRHGRDDARNRVALWIALANFRPRG